MRYTTLLLCTAALLILAAAAVAPAGATGSSLAVTGVQVSPGVLMPGDRGTISVTFENTAGPGGAGAAIDRVAMSGDGSVNVTPDAFSTTETLGPGDSATFTFQASADLAAASGVYYPRLDVWTDDGVDSLEYQVPVRIDSTEARVLVDQAPASIDAAGGNVVLDVINPRADEISSVSVVPVGDDLVFKPLQEYYVGDVGPGESYTVEFGVRSRNATAGETPAFELKYRNGDNWHQTAAVQADLAGDAGSTGDEGGLGVLVVLIGLVVILAGCVFVIMRRKRARK